MQDHISQIGLCMGRPLLQGSVQPTPYEKLRQLAEGQDYKPHLPPQVKPLRVVSDARIGRAQFHRARSASKKDGLTALFF
jgi:hypothetical protein